MTTAQITVRADGFYTVREPDGTRKDRCRIELRMKDAGIEIVFVEQPTGPLPRVDWPTVQGWLQPWYEQEEVTNALGEAIDVDDVDPDTVAYALDELGWKLVRK